MLDDGWKAMGLLRLFLLCGDGVVGVLGGSK